MSSLSQQIQENELFCIPKPAISRMLMFLLLSWVFVESNAKMSLIDDIINCTKFL